jgi:hypothetical protein
MDASRIRVRAERRLGEILKVMAHNEERRTRASAKSSSAARLDQLGIPKDRASRAMQLAEVPEAQFEAALAEPGVAQPRRILDERADKARYKAEKAAITRTLNLWGSVRDMGNGITAGEFPPLDNWGADLQQFQLEDLRRSIPVILEYLSTIQEELRK